MYFYWAWKTESSSRVCHLSVGEGHYENGRELTLNVVVKRNYVDSGGLCKVAGIVAMVGKESVYTIASLPRGDSHYVNVWEP